MFQGFSIRGNYQDRLYPTKGIDGDAKSFIDTAGITDIIQQYAINNLVVQLKNYGLWTKMKAIYPFIGGTATTHRFNLKMNAFHLNFVGGWTHYSTGALPNGTNGYANTYVSPNGNQSLTSGHFSVYSRTSIAGTTFAGNGVRDVTTALGVQLTLRRGDSIRFLTMWDEGTGGLATAGSETDAKGFYLGSRIANNNLTYYKNAISIGSNTNAQTANALSINTYFLSAINQGGTPIGGTYDNKEIAFASIGDGLTDVETSNFYLVVQNYQSILNRQV